MHWSAFAIIVSGALAAASPAPTPVSSPASCASTPGFHELDFWIGSWQVTSGNRLAGTDIVKQIFDDCAVVENWSDADGSHGMSLFYYNSYSDVWTQIWVTDRATERGGLKEKYLIGRFPDGGVRFQGRLPGPPGSSVILDRTTLTPMADGTVHQLIEITRDGGSHWLTTFDATYARG